MAPEPKLPEEVSRADTALAAIAGGFDILDDVSPVNVEAQWHRWQSFRQPPRFDYRPDTVDHQAVQRRVDAVDLTATAGHPLHDLLVRSAEQLSAEAALVGRRDRPGFVDASRRLYGGVDDGLLQLASDLLERLPEANHSGGLVSAREFARRAEREVAAYRSSAGTFAGSVEVRDDVPSLRVVGRRLSVGTDSYLPAHRVEALVHHEVGVHLFTAETGGRQPLRLLERGTAGYVETQEALGVVAEYVSGGIDADRLRVLAARVVATRMWCDGATFEEVVDALVGVGLDEQAAWTVTMRVARGGGLTKDAVYLRGLVDLAGHLAEAPLRPLLIGKFHLRDLPIVTALLDAGVLDDSMLQPGALWPRWLRVEGAEGRLETIGNQPLQDWVR